MKCYISGPITGREDYKRNFERAEKILAERHGFETVNPVRLAEALDGAIGKEDKGLEKKDYMKSDIAGLITMCDSIAMLEGYERSEGASLELAIARALGYRIYFLNLESEELLDHEIEFKISFPFQKYSFIKEKGLI